MRPHRTMALVGGLAMAGLGVRLGAGTMPVWAQSAALQPVAKAAVATATAKSTPSAGAEKVTLLPVRQIALYKNGVGFFEQVGQVRGDELVRIDFTTEQLNDALQSLTAVDLGGGKIAGLGYDATQTLQQQIASLRLGLGEDPTVLDFLHAIKGLRVEVHTGTAVITGRVLNVEVKTQPDAKTGAMVEHRMISIVTGAGGLRTLELTPSVEVRMLDAAMQQEIGRYLRLLATTHDPPMRHLTLEDKGTGAREVHVSYLSAMPAWKSSYRILFSDSSKGTGGKDASGNETATLQGWAVVDNTSATDWENVQLTLVSGAPQSFIQQISRPNYVARPEIGMQGQAVPSALGRARPARITDPIAASQQASLPINASAMGGGGGIEIVQKTPQPLASATQPNRSPTAPPSDGDDYQAEAENSLAPQASSVDMDDLFEYKLSKPITIRKNESAVVPILQTGVGAERVTVWNGNNHTTMRALWLKNTSALTLDRGSFSVMENGVYGGQGQIGLLHPNERRLAAYAVDQAVKVSGREAKDPPAVPWHVLVYGKGIFSVHRRLMKEHDYTIQNIGTSARAVVLEVPHSQPLPKWNGGWSLTTETPAVEKADGLYRFEVRVAPNATSRLKVLETHSHPTHYDLRTTGADELDTLVAEVKNADVTAKIQPIIDDKRKLTDLQKKIRAEDTVLSEIAAEQGRIRQNVAALKGSPEQQSLAKRYTDEMNAQEDKLAAVHREKDSFLQQRDAVQSDLEATIASIQLDVELPAS